MMTLRVSIRFDAIETGREVSLLVLLSVDLSPLHLILTNHTPSAALHKDHHHQQPPPQPQWLINVDSPCSSLVPLDSYVHLSAVRRVLFLPSAI